MFEQPGTSSIPLPPPPPPILSQQPSRDETLPPKKEKKLMEIPREVHCYSFICFQSHVIAAYKCFYKHDRFSLLTINLQTTLYLLLFDKSFFKWHFEWQIIHANMAT